MTKGQAQKKGFCEVCAAYWGDWQNCGIAMRSADKKLCSLDIETQLRWRSEYNIGNNHQHGRPIWRAKL